MTRSVTDSRSSGWRMQPISLLLAGLFNSTLQQRTALRCLLLGRFQRLLLFLLLLFEGHIFLVQLTRFFFRGLQRLLLASFASTHTDFTVKTTI
uniref:Uncharacterized protein n=1 Tax=Anopheles darlingi TaxID=43151 RepID=A0A2M4D5B8_ANODA